MVIKEIEGGIAIHRIASSEDWERWMPGLVAAYHTVFSGFPYFERYLDDEVHGTFSALASASGGIVLVAADGDTVAGFSAAIPLHHKASVANQLTGLVPIQHTFYLAELGVLPQYRGRKIGRNLVRERLRLIDPDQYSHVVLRISTDNTPSGEMYKALGFFDMGVTMHVTRRRQDGEVRQDERLFLSRVLSQVPMATEEIDLSNVPEDLL